VLAAPRLAIMKRQHRLDGSQIYEVVKWHLCLGRYCSMGDICRAPFKT